MSNLRAIVVQLLATIILSLQNVLMSCMICWPSHALEFLNGDATPLTSKPTKFENNMLGTLPMVGGMLSTLSAGFINDFFGRKKSEILVGILSVFSWTMIATGRDVIQLMVGRFVAGLAAGIHVVVVLVFISEYSQPSLRGTLVTSPIFGFCFGSLISYIGGWFCSYDVINYTGLTFSVICVLLVSWLKETPVYLIRREKDKEALISLKFYRGVSKTTQDVLDEITALKKQCEAVDTDNKLIQNGKQNCEVEKLEITKNSQELEASAWKIVCTSKETQRALVTLTVIIFLTTLVGPIAVQSYGAEIFKHAVPGLSPHICTVALAISITIGSGISLVICDILPRRILFISTMVMSALCLALVGSMLRWSWAPQWMIPAAILAYTCFYQMGSATVPFVQLAESFTPKVKSLSTTICLSSLTTGNVVLMAIFNVCVEMFGLDITFFIFSLIGISTALIAFLIVRETKGVPLEQVLKMFREGYLYKRP